MALQCWQYPVLKIEGNWERRGWDYLQISGNCRIWWFAVNECSIPWFLAKIELFQPKWRNKGLGVHFWIILYIIKIILKYLLKAKNENTSNLRFSPIFNPFKTEVATSLIDMVSAEWLKKNRKSVKRTKNDGNLRINA